MSLVAALNAARRCKDLSDEDIRDVQRVLRQELFEVAGTKQGSPVSRSTESIEEVLKELGSELRARRKLPLSSSL